MASKRTFDDEEDHQGNDDRDLGRLAKRRHGDPQEAEAMFIASLIASHLRPAIQKEIKEGLRSMFRGCACLCSPRSSINQQGGASTSGGRAMQLCFVNKLPIEFFTTFNITAEDGGPVQIELRYAGSQQRVVTEQVSNMKVQICVLDGDFGKDGNEDWSADEFNAQIVKPREGKGQLLKGETVIKLEKGFACINNKIEFTDNSIGTRNKKFRLGVKFLQSTSVSVSVREGRSEAFRVKDKRGEPYKKRDRPSLNDEVWCLKNIRRNGDLHKDLLKNKIKTVKDLLRLNTIGSLREKFGKVKKWDEIIEHAEKCAVDDDGFCMYRYDATVSLVLNCIYKVEAIFYGQHYRSLQSLNLEEQRLVERVKQEAYQNLQNLVPIPTPPPHDIVKTLTGTQYGSPDQGQQGQSELWISTTSTSIVHEAPLNLSGGSQVVPVETYNIDDGTGWDIGQFESYILPNQLLEPVNPCSFPYGDGATSSNHSFFLNPAVYTSSKGKSKTVWQKTRNILKWVIPHVTKWKVFRPQILQHY
nr:hypothetical protein JHK86_008318 [Glycine max]